VPSVAPVPWVPVAMAPANACGFTSPWLASDTPFDANPFRTNSVWYLAYGVGGGDPREYVRDAFLFATQARDSVGKNSSNMKLMLNDYNTELAGKRDNVLRIVQYVMNAGNGTAAGAKININTASAGELDELPRVGPVLAERIVAWREEHGPFAAVEELDAVDRFGFAVEHGGGLPDCGRLAQRLLGLVVAGDQDRRGLDPRQGGDRLPEALVDGGEVAGADHHVGLGAALDDALASLVRRGELERIDLLDDSAISRTCCLPVTRQMVR